MDSYRSSLVVHAPVGDVRAAVDALMTSVWTGRTELIAEEPGRGATYTVAGPPSETEGDVWLSWQFDATLDRTRVTVVLDELDHGPDATEELAMILRTLQAAVEFARKSR
jgi:hypothetical protein